VTYRPPPPRINQLKIFYAAKGCQKKKKNHPQGVAHLCCCCNFYGYIYNIYFVFLRAELSFVALLLCLTSAFYESFPAPNNKNKQDRKENLSQV